MPKIQKLPDILISQIAAGEVVERPASVVKELLENSIDAGATRIELEVEQGGDILIALRDDGCGMHPEDALASFQRHATSKIRALDDLQAIGTFGFRGEALAAIASVAQVVLRTRTKEDEAGFEVRIDGGKLQDKGTIGCPPGTEIIVRNLFFNTPARKKFLKRSSTELAHIAAEVQAAALVHPKVAFRLMSDGKIIIDVSAHEKVQQRIAAILGTQFSQELQAVLAAQDTLTISGFIAHPGSSLSSRRRQFLFVNKRPITDAAIARAVMHAYGSRLPARTFPSFVLFLEVNPNIVDVNVHPRKLMVKFHDTGKVYRAVHAAVTHALEERQRETIGKLQNVSSFGSIAPQKQAVQDAMNFSQEFAHGTHEDKFKRERDHELKSEFSTPTILTYIADSYIVVRDTDGISFIDQHAAHERVTYERLKRAFDERKPQSQPLLLSLQLELSADELALIRAAQPLLEQLGFEFDHWSGNTIVVQACPAQIAHEKLETIIRDVIAEVREDSGPLQEKISPERMLKSLACKSSVTFGMPLTPHEQEALLRDLANTPNSATCPHGRPTKALMTFKELRNKFYR